MTASGSLVLRPERDGDAAFRAALFAAHHAPLLAATGAPGSTIDFLVGMQFRAQTESYAARFPEARRLILESDGRPVGRMIVEAEATDLYVVDIAVLPDVQGRGLGGAAVTAVQRDAAATGLGVRALVDAGNGPSLAMFRRRGFAATGRTAGPSLELRWTA